MTFFKKLFAYSQYLMPQHFLSWFYGLCGNCAVPWLKNLGIQYLIKRYKIDMSQAENPDPKTYRTFNAFFTRKLRAGARPLPADPKKIVSPVDGFIAQVSPIEKKTLLQAKGFTYSLDALLGCQTDSGAFNGGQAISLYLSPQHYHRVHMPYPGTLKKMRYIPGKLFSVCPASFENIPNLYTRNERVVCFFETACGPMVVVFIGALLVGSMATQWHGVVNTDRHQPQTWDYPDNPTFDRGDELGYFQMGSSVIVLFGKDQINWGPGLTPGSELLYGQALATLV